MPFCTDDEIGQENPVRFIGAFVDELNIEELGFVRVQPADTGRPAYSPRTLLKLYLYGHMNRIRSSRMLERECRRNIELWWLLEKLCPDHNTIALFRAKNRKGLLKVFKLFVRICAEMKLCSTKRACIDGTTIKAVNGMDAATSTELSRKKLEYTRKQLALVEKYLSGLDENDRIDSNYPEPALRQCEYFSVNTVFRDKTTKLNKLSRGGISPFPENHYIRWP